MASPPKVVVRLGGDTPQVSGRLVRTGTNPAAPVRRVQVLLKTGVDGSDGLRGLRR